MKIGVLFEGSPKKPGGFYQSLQSVSALNEIKNEKFDLEFICLEKETYNLLSQKNFKVKIYSSSFYKKIFNFFLYQNFFKNFVVNYKINHPFTNFINKNNYELIIFLSPNTLSFHCGKVNFVINIWDLDHKKNSPYPEHRINYNFFKREELINYLIFHSFKIISPEEKTKEELIRVYQCDKNKIVTQSFIPYLPDIYKKESDTNFHDIFKKFNFPKKKIILYPANFWPHKNHKYLIDVAKIMKAEQKNEYLFIFCGGDSGNLNFIKNEIKKFSLEKYFITLPLVTDLELISLYLNTHIVVMPTTGGPTNLPLYEAFFFKKVIFYNCSLLHEKELISNSIGIDIKNPNDFYNKLIKLQNQDIDLITSGAFEFYKKRCSTEQFKKNYIKTIKEFLESRSQWK